MQKSTLLWVAGFSACAPMLAIAQAQGAWLEDTQGRRYLDALAAPRENPR